MIFLDFNPVFPDQTERFAVFICPKCRIHAQILEQSIKKTTHCQHCGSLLRVRKLRIFFSSDELSEAVSARTYLQTELSGKDALQFLKNLSENPETPVFPSQKTGNPVRLPQDKVKKANSPKKSHVAILFELLEARGGRMEVGELKAAALEKGLGSEKFEQVLGNLLKAGELYSPSNGIIKIA